MSARYCERQKREHDGNKCRSYQNCNHDTLAYIGDYPQKQPQNLLFKVYYALRRPLHETATVHKACETLNLGHLGKPSLSQQRLLGASIRSCSLLVCANEPCDFQGDRKSVFGSEESICTCKAAKADSLEKTRLFLFGGSLESMSAPRLT